MTSRNLDIVTRAVGATQAAQQIGKVDSAVHHLSIRGTAAGVALGNLASTAISKGISSLVGTVQSGLQSMADLESATNAVDASIKQVGLTGQVTATQVASWANEIETSIGGAFDDTDITRAATTLLRFGKVTAANLRPALTVVADLATKTGDVGSASSLLAKALAAPEKAAGRLSRAGVILTKSQQDQIKALVKAGDVGKAQALILDAVATATKGAAAASQGPYQRSLSVLHDTVRDAERALAEGFLPVLEKVRGLLSTELAKPQTLQNIRDFGKALAGGLDNVITTVRSLPWESIGNALRIGGAGAKAVLDAFIAMPPWVQTAIATGWGLNKLTGGALSGVVGQLASGLIKGVLGMTAGVVNINAGVVNGGGGVPGVPGAGGGKGLNAIPTLGALGIAGLIVSAAVPIGQGLRKGLGITFGTQSQDLHSRALSDMATRGVFTPDTKKAVENAIAEAKTQGAQERDKIESMRIALASKTSAVESAVATNTSAAHSDTARMIDAIDRIQFPKTLTTNVTIKDTGDPGHRYQSSQTISTTRPNAGGSSARGQ